ncbi:MAG: aminopeptidase P family protein [Deltaproteobacteria bacterium]|nr:aminopeptidase P family protein [Deltaproteobacteria bacterium]MBM4322908.1 aminopeptidase P family protein [Deltaproteobacteria bacterium]MBM4347316.1 aminopeptidase P family protein [Deltaproteobacteria bacterium]
MHYKDWVKNEFMKLSQSLGFQYIPGQEIQNRLKRVRDGMKKQGIESLLVIQKMDFYYLSGTTQDGFLFLPLEGKPLLMIKRELERARVESPIDDVVSFKSIRDLPLLIQKRRKKLPRNMGLEFDLLPVRDYFKFQEIFPRITLKDSSSVFREARKIKSDFEIDLMRRAGEIGKKVYEEVRGVLKEGMTEIELGGLMEAVAKKHGHEGLLRVRSLNYQAYSWHILSGPIGGIVSQSDSPMGGLGLSPAFPVGASLRKMRAREPILVDFGICYHGYQADQTRMFSIGRMKKKFINAYQACCEIHDAVLEEVRPGADCEAIFAKTLRLAKKLGYKDSYLGPPELQTRFIGHGIGLELNELPFIAQGHSYPLEEGMTVAVEPKIVFPGEGAVGIENTVVVTKNGYKILTPTEQEIFQV